MAHGRNNPTGNIGFSPTLITLFAPIAFMVQAWQRALVTFFAVLGLLFVFGWFSHCRDLRRIKSEASRASEGR